MPSTNPPVRVGVGAFVLESKQQSHENPRFLIGKRRNAHGAGAWATPGGHLEFGETPEDCAAREVIEETGLKVTNIRFLTATNDYMPADNKHYVTMWTVCEREDDNAKAEVMEPQNCEAWEWASWEELLEWVKWQDEAREGDVLKKKLFKPFLSLINQRAGVKPKSLQTA